MKRVYLFLITLLFLLSVPIFSKYTAMAQDMKDMVRLGKVGEWNNNYGDFRAVNVKEIEGVNYAFCVTSKGMAVFSVHYVDIGQNRTSAEVALIPPFVPIGDCTDIKIVSDERGGYRENIYAYITEKDKGLYIRNVTNPAFTYHKGSCDTPGRSERVAISGGYAYVADGESGFQVIDITNPSVPVRIGSCDTPGRAEGVTVSGGYAYVADGGRGLQVIDITDPNIPIVGSCNTLRLII